MSEVLEDLLQLINVEGKILGRKRLQKMVYVLQCKGFGFDERFSYHYYGPYSAVLRMEVDDLVRFGLLKEEKIGETYEYSVTERANNYVSEGFYSENQIALIKMLNKKPTSVLELVSVFFYLENSGYKDWGAIMRKTKILKPELHSYLNDAHSLYLEVKNTKIAS